MKAANRARPDRIQYQGQCQSKNGYQLAAAIQIEYRDSIGHPFWNRDFCEAHAQPIVKRAELRGIPVSWL